MREQLAAFYCAALKAMTKCGLPPIGASSPMEYCAMHHKRISGVLGENSDFTALTHAFERAFYGGIAPSEGERAEFLALYKRLPSICRRSVGAFRYAAMFFRV